MNTENSPMSAPPPRIGKGTTIAHGRSMPVPGKPIVPLVPAVTTLSEGNREAVEDRVFPKVALASGALTRVRSHRRLLQLELAEKLAVSQPHVANMEQKTDMLLSTLQRYVKALGGQLELVARFDDVSFHLSPREDLKRTR